MKTNKKYIVLVLIVVVFITLQLVLKNYISQKPEYREIMVSNPFNTLPPAEYLGSYVATVALGGFKPLLVDYLWMKQSKLQEDKQFEEIRLLLSIIARLQPRFMEVWSFNAYHMIYNIAVQENTPEARWRWVKSGIEYIKEGMMYNPNSPELTREIAFFYYNRIPQDDYFMRKIEETEKLNTFQIAADWFQKTMDLYKEKKGIDARTIYGPMYFACHFSYSFELIKKNRFDEAIQELEGLINYSHEMVQLYPLYTAHWQPEISRVKDLIKVIQYDKEISQVEMSRPDFIAKNSLLLAQYGNIIDKNVGYDFKPINARVEFIMSRYIQYAYRLVDDGRYSEALAVIKLLRDDANKILPKLDNHPAGWYYRSLLERFEKLNDLISAESYLRKEGLKDFKTDRLGLELKSMYEEYTKKYSAYWSLSYERQKFGQLY